MKKLLSVFILLFGLAEGILLCPSSVYSQASVTYTDASDIDTDTSNFDNNLSSSDTTVQKALDTLDDTAGGGGLSNAYTHMTDGTNTSDSSGADTFRFRSANSLLSLTVENDNATYGDNLLLTIQPNLSNYTNDAGFITASSTDTLTNKSGNISMWTNDSGYLTSYTETDPIVGAINGLIKADGAGNISQAVAGTDYVASESDPQFDTKFSAKTTDDLSEGTTNLYSTLTNIKSACSNDFHNIGGTDANTTYTADGNGIELTGTEFGLELDGTTLSKSASGLKVNSITTTEISDGTITATDMNSTLDLSSKTLTLPSAPKNQLHHWELTIAKPNDYYTNTNTELLIAADVPANLTITHIYVTHDADPTTELDANLRKCSAYISRNTSTDTVINALDTTNGVLDDSTITAGSVSAGDDVYIQFDAAPDSSAKELHILVEWDYD